MFVSVNMEITIHFGTNPSKGGMPPRDSKISIKEEDILVGRCIEVLNLVVEIFIIDLIGAISIIVISEYRTKYKKVIL